MNSQSLSQMMEGTREECELRRSVSEEGIDNEWKRENKIDSLSFVL